MDVSAFSASRTSHVLVLVLVFLASMKTGSQVGFFGFAFAQLQLQLQVQVQVENLFHQLPPGASTSMAGWLRCLFNSFPADTWPCSAFHALVSVWQLIFPASSATSS